MAATVDSGVGGRMERLAAHWVYGAAILAPILILMTPLLGLTGGALWTFLTLPIYMLHQYEEHDADRFRRFVNTRLGPMRAGLSPMDVLVINVVGVWVLVAVTLALVVLADPGWALIAAYLLLVNGFVHVAQGVALRTYNPGLLTAVVLFLPVAAAIFLATSGVASSLQHGVALILVVGVHAAILVHVLRRPAH